MLYCGKLADPSRLTMLNIYNASTLRRIRA
jgi:hypothetical protein